MEEITTKKYSKVLNLNGLDNKLDRLLPNQVEQLMQTKFFITEKLHGENFRIGIDHKGRKFIGQKNKKFTGDDIPNHPNYNKFSQKLVQQINNILDFFSRNELSNVILYGELCGKGLQKGFDWPFERLRVYFFDMYINNTWLTFEDLLLTASDMSLQTVTKLDGTYTLKEIINFPVEELKSTIANNDYVEGIVARPTNYEEVKDLWRFDDRLIVKVKTEKFTEESRKPKVRTEKKRFVSEFHRFVTPERINHAIEHLKEQGVEIFNKPRDLKYIPERVIQDITEECNEGIELPKEDHRFLRKYVPQIYLQMLKDNLKEKHNG